MAGSPEASGAQATAGTGTGAQSRAQAADEPGIDQIVRIEIQLDREPGEEDRSSRIHSILPFLYHIFLLSPS